MRAQVLQAITLVAALYAAGPLVAPAKVHPEQLPFHVGQSVEVEGLVVDVEPSGSLWRVTVEADGSSALVLERGTAPPLGAHVRVVGDASTDREGAVLWAKAWSVEEAPEHHPEGVRTVLEKAPRLVGTSVAVVGMWDEEALAVREADASLPVVMRASRPPAGLGVVTWGVLVYDASSAGFVLQGVGWEPWTR